MTPRNPAVLSTRPLATPSPGSEASPRTNPRPRRATKLPERYRPGDSSSPHTPSTSSTATPIDGPIVAEGSRWITFVTPLKPGERPETLREARIRQGLPLNGPLPVIQHPSKGWVVQLEPAPEQDAPEKQKKAVTPSRKQIRQSMVGKKPRQHNHQVAAKTYKGADAGDAMEVETDQHEGSGVVGVGNEQQDDVDGLEVAREQDDSADIPNMGTEQHDSADPMDLDMANDDRVTDSRASSPLSEPMSDNALENLLKTPVEESETSSSQGELPPHPAFTGQDLALGALSYLAKHLRDKGALDVLNEVEEPALPRHQQSLTLHSPTTPPPLPPTSPPLPPVSSIAALSQHTASPRAISRTPASLRPASLQPISSPPGSPSPIDSPPPPSPSTLTPRTTASPQPASPAPSMPMPLPLPTSPSPSPSPPPPPGSSSHPIALSSSSSSSPPSSTPSPPQQFHLSPYHHNQTHRGPVWSDWIALWAGSSYVPDHVRDILDTIPEDGPYFDVAAGQVQTVNALCSTEVGDAEQARRAREANYVVEGVGGRYMRTRARR